MPSKYSPKLIAEVVSLKRHGKLTNILIAKRLGLVPRAVRHLVDMARHHGELPPAEKSFAHQSLKPTRPLTDNQVALTDQEDQGILKRQQRMLADADGALRAAYGDNCFARFNLSIPSEHGFFRGAPNPFVHEAASP